MSLLQTLKVVGTAGAQIALFDDVGVKDATNRLMHAPHFIKDRLFATPLAAYMWTCVEGVWQVVAVNAKYSVVGGAACTCDVLVCSGVVAPGSGVSQLTAVLSLTATAPASVNGTLIASPTLILPGDSLARVIAGTPGSLEGVVSVHVKRVS